MTICNREKDKETDMNRIHPSAVCRQLIANLETHKRLSKDEQTAILSAIQNTGIPVERVLADLSRNVIEETMGAF